ncbi:MAG: hypothetical protein O3B24_04110 [Verrucomicrobia bacterium]|nr:hypothetical protein [Verrucomicrobiota bacterium]
MAARRRYGFKRSYMRRAFWRANGLITAILGLCGMGLIITCVRYFMAID